MDQFSKARAGRLQAWCRPCNREYQRKHYVRNKAAYIADAAARKAIRSAENLARILEYFQEHPCVDCGESDPLVLHFDHVRGLKVDEVTDLVYGGSSWDRIQNEIDKCEVRCGRCHFRRTAMAAQWRRHTLASAESVMSPAKPFMDSARGALPPGGAASSSSATTLKWCSWCGWDLPTHEFPRKGAGWGSKCKACQRAYSRDHYRRNRAGYIARARDRTSRVRTAYTLKVIEYLRDHPCVDCGEPDLLVPQFDHVRGTKSANIAQMVSDTVPWARIEDEIAKCVVRCVNCHVRRTLRVRDTRKLRMRKDRDASLGSDLSGPIV